jgi:hypothetical protein
MPDAEMRGVAMDAKAGLEAHLKALLQKARAENEALDAQVAKQDADARRIRAAVGTKLEAFKRGADAIGAFVGGGDA